MSCPGLPLQPYPLLAPHANKHPGTAVLPLVIRMVHCIFSHAFESFYLLSLLPEMPFPTQFYSLNWSSSITCSKKPSLITRPTQTVLSAQFSSVAQSCPTLCDPMNCSTPGLPVHHHLPEFTHSDAIQPSHPRSSPSPPAPNPSQHQSLFQ